jgi:hypothetical protein
VTGGTEADKRPNRTPSPWVPVAISSIALLFSIWTWYYNMVQVRHSLTAVLIEHDVPIMAIIAGDNVAVTYRFLVTNGGNRTATIENADFYFISNARDEGCRSGPRARNLYFPAQGRKPLAVVKANEAVDVSFDFSIKVNWERDLPLGSSVMGCLSVSVLDQSGEIHRTAQQLLEVISRPELSSWQTIRATMRLL